jgi:hypothetical protein
LQHVALYSDASALAGCTIMVRTVGLSSRCHIRIHGLYCLRVAYKSFPASGMCGLSCRCRCGALAVHSVHGYYIFRACMLHCFPYAYTCCCTCQ